MGDLGNAFSEEQLWALEDQVDVLFALTGGQPTITLEDLDAAISTIRPRVIVPMHYYSGHGRLTIRKVEDFVSRYPQQQVTYVNSVSFELSKETLPDHMHIYILNQSR